MSLYLGSQKISSVLTTYGTYTFDATDATALAEHIQLGYTAYVGGKKITGTMNPNPATIKVGEVIAGVTGTFTSDANATAAQIQSGKTAYVNGVKVTGTLAPAAANIKTGVTIAGVAGTFTADATATAAQIQSGKTAYVNGVKITGTLAPAATDIKAGATIAGVAGTFTSDANATAAQILNGKTAYVNGTKITGTALATATTATAAYIRKNYTAYNNSGTLLTGTMAEYTTAAQQKTPSTTQDIAVNLPAGYYPNDHTVTIKKATGGSAVAVGSVSGASSFVISGLSFTPKGIFAILPGAGFHDDDDINVYAFYAQNSTTATVCYSSGTTGTQATRPLSTTNGLSLISTTNDDGAVWGDIPMSVLDVWLDSPISDWGVSGYYIGDEFSTSTISPYTTTASVTYSAGSVTVNLSGCYVSGTFYYVVWG